MSQTRAVSIHAAFAALAFLAIFAGNFMVGKAPATASALEPASRYTPQRALNNLNNWRSLAGIPPVESLDSEKSEGCRLHNRYMLKHGIGHGEDETSSLYTELGKRAGAGSVLSGGEFLPRPAWEDAVYHRANLLNPRLRVTGYSASFEYTCMHTSVEVGSRAEGKIDDIRLYPWPYDGQTNVPLRFEAWETPNPYEEAPGSKQLGYLTSVSVNGPWSHSPKSYVTEASLTSGSGKQMPIAVSDAESKYGNHMKGGFGLFPKVALQPGTWYTARATGRTVGTNQNGRKMSLPFQKSWRFRTVLLKPKIIQPRLRLRKIGQGKRKLRFRLKHHPRLRGQYAQVVIGRINCGSARYCGKRRHRVIRRFRMKLKAGPTKLQITRARSSRTVRTLKVVTPRTKIDGNRIIAGGTVERRIRGSR